MLTQEDLKQRLHYEPETGIFRYVKDTNNKMKKGNAAGSLHSSGYVHIKIDGRGYKAHRLAWLYMTGEFPAFDVDHIDEKKMNNSWGNLRLANDSQNTSNRGKNKNNTSGFKGVTFDKECNKFRAQIGKNGGLKKLGRFNTAEEASFAYQRAAVELHGEYAKW